MNFKIKHYPQVRICDEFYAVIDFLKNHSGGDYNKNWHWARWEWLLGHSMLDEATLSSIVMFMDEEKIAGLLTHDMGQAFYCLTNPQYLGLKTVMIDCAIENGICEIFGDENDDELLALLNVKGFSLTDDREHTLVMNCKEKFSYNLDEKFQITDFSKSKDIDKFCLVFHKGFENSGEPPTGLTLADFPEQPHQNPELTVFIAAPNGEYAAHCGVWYLPETQMAYIEPVVTIPDFQGYGLGKAVVYEAVNRAIDIGAKQAMVISNQPFYHKIGFKPHAVSNLWEKKL